MKKFLFIWCFLLGLVLNSCGYYCYVFAIGSEPQSNQYYILPNNPNLKGDLEFMKYAEMLTTALNRVGYQNVSEEQAKNIIYFDWQIGNLTTETETSSITYNTYSSSITTNWVSTPYGSSYPQMSSTMTATPQTSSFSYSTDYAPIAVHIIAVDKQTHNQIWKTTINDKLEYSKTTMSNLLPMMLYAGSKYFGTTEERRVDVFPSEASNQGIPWPY